MKITTALNPEGRLVTKITNDGTQLSWFIDRWGDVDMLITDSSMPEKQYHKSSLLWRELNIYLQNFNHQGHLRNWLVFDEN